MKPKSTVLFIDDDKHLTRTMRDFLTHEGFDVLTALTAEAGLKLIEKTPPDLIVLDISMPGMGGIGFLKRISDKDGRLQYPVLVLTARAVMKEFFDTVAVDGFLSKPCSELDLIRTIRSILDSRKQANAPAATMRILLGEDDKALRPSYEQKFQRAGFEVVTVPSGPEMIEQAVAVQPHVIVMKELLPNMNGSTVARLIRTMPHTRNIPIIIHDATRLSPPTDSITESANLFLLSASPRDLLDGVQRVLKAATGPPRTIRA